MPAKRKRNDPQSTPLQSEEATPRRSGRNGGSLSAALEATKSAPVAGRGVLNDRLRDGDRRPRLQGKTSHESRKEVERALRNLKAMENELQTTTRNQRKALESSDLKPANDAMMETETTIPLLPDPPSSIGKQVTNQDEEKSANAVEQAPLDGCEAELAKGDIAAAAKDSESDENGVQRGARRTPAVNSETLPLPWSGRLGYACLNTYLRASNPTVFSSRTCRMSSIIEHRHPLRNPDEPEHATKNRPDKDQPADVERGQRYLQDMGLANARDIVKMLRWNDKYGIKFMRLSSEMFPFASHAEHGYKLEPFAAEVLAAAGKVAGELGHRLTTHPGQFTQLGSPRNDVITAAVRDLEYHAEMLSLLKLPEQQDRDAVMILHMGGTYGDKAATLDRFRENYQKLPQNVKDRLVLENDDVSWTVHDLLPICEELNIPLVLDFHHHNILFDPSMREGTLDIMSLYDRIAKTWSRKNIRQKMHYSEQTSSAVTPRERRKHSARVRTLPPCPNDMDLMIEAKDKEQAVFELMRTFKLPGWSKFNDIVPFERDDEPRKAIMKKKKKAQKTKPRKRQKTKAEDRDEGHAHTNDVNSVLENDDVEVPEKIVSPEDFGMGGPENRVFWPEGMEEWLKPRKREVKKGKKTEDVEVGSD